MTENDRADIETRRKAAPPKTRKRWGWWRWTLLAILLLVAMVSLLVWLFPPSITVSVKTTRVLGPLDEEGFVDYLAVVDQAASEGITRENNGAVVLCQSMNPTEVPPEIRTEFYRRLGISPAEDGAKLLRSFEDFATKDLPEGEALDWSTVESQTEAAWKQPWSAQEFHLMARWVQQQSPAFEIAIEASSRPRFYAPGLSTTSPRVLGITLPLQQHSRFLARGLVTRAMLHIEQGDVQQAWRDLLATHRLARLVSQAPFIMSKLVSVAIDEHAVRGSFELARSPALTIEFAEGILAEVQSLPPRSRLVDGLQYERLTHLDTMQTVFRLGPHALDGDDSGVQAWVTHFLMRRLPNWDTVMERSNEWFDRADALTALETPWAQRSAIAEFSDELRELGEDYGPAGGEGWLNERERLGRSFADIFIRRMFPMLHSMGEDRTNTRLEMLKVVLALRLWKFRTGQYPAALGELAPDYLPAIPTDRITGEPFRYEVNDQGARLYSVGANKVDETRRVGREPKDATPEEQDSTDDIVVSLP